MRTLKLVPSPVKRQNGRTAIDLIALRIALQTNTLTERDAKIVEAFFPGLVAKLKAGA